MTSSSLWYLVNRENFNIIGIPTGKTNGEIIGETMWQLPTLLL